MHNYQWLIWKHKRALAVFEKVRAKLEKLANQIQQEIMAQHERIAQQEAAIMASKNAIAAIQSHHTTVTSQYAKVSAILE